MTRKAVWSGLLGAVSLTLPAHAQDATQPSSVRGETVRGDQAQAIPELHVEASQSASDVVDRAPAGGAAFRLRPTMQGDFGTWANAPSAPEKSAATIAGGEVGITSRLSFLLEGAQDSFDLTRSGALAGLRYHLMPAPAPFQLSLSGGALRDLGQSQAAWGELDASQSLGRLRLAGSLRVTRLDVESAAQQTVSGSTGASIDLKAARVGLDYAFDRGIVPRSAVLPWVAVPSGQRSVVHITGALPLGGAGAFPARVSWIGAF